MILEGGDGKPKLKVKKKEKKVFWGTTPVPLAGCPSNSEFERGALKRERRGTQTVRKKIRLGLELARK